MKPDISAFVVAYNDAETIGDVIQRLLAVLDGVAHRCEVIVVLYEGSTDGTREIVRGYRGRDSRVEIVCQPREQKGYGVALRLGIGKARYELVFYTDGDGQYDVDEIKLLIDAIEGADIVSGRRIRRRDPMLRLFTAAVYNWLINTLFPTGLRDIDSAFKLYRKEVLDKIDVVCRTGLADAEILAKAKMSGARIREVPISHYPRRSGRPVFEIGVMGKLGIVHPRVVFQLVREMRLLWKQIRKQEKDTR